MNTNWEKVLSDSKLITLPEVYIKLQQIIYNDDFSLAEITEVIGFDPAVTARLLRMVNSSFFGLASRIDTVSHAVNYLGAQQVHDLVLATSIAQSFNEMNNEAFNLHQFWHQSVYCAVTARELAVLCNVLDSERLFVTGLLHDIGHLMMRQSIPDLTQQAELNAQEKNISLSRSEIDLIGFDYTSVGAQLLKNWNLPDSLTNSIKYQLEPARAEDFHLETAILNIAGVMTHSFSKQIPEQELLSLMDSEAVNITAINYEHLTAVDRMSHENLGTVINLLFPQLQVASA